jgi:RNA polymerase sigma-70 factor (ECF subfamily)
MLRQFPQVRRWEQTEDVFQTAAFRLFNSLAIVKPDNPRAYLGLAATQIRRTLIDLARHHFGPLGDGAHHASDPALREGEHPLPAAESTAGPETLEDWAAFHEAIDCLPTDLREVFGLRWYHGMSQEEIARVLNVSVPTVQRKWYAAQIELHDRLQEATEPRV